MRASTAFHRHLYEATPSPPGRDALRRRDLAETDDLCITALRRCRTPRSRGSPPPSNITPVQTVGSRHRQPRTRLTAPFHRSAPPVRRSSAFPTPRVGADGRGCFGSGDIPADGRLRCGRPACRTLSRSVQRAPLAPDAPVPRVAAMEGLVGAPSVTSSVRFPRGPLRERRTSSTAIARFRLPGTLVR
jgi:hypothetical protein